MGYPTFWRVGSFLGCGPPQCDKSVTILFSSRVAIFRFGLSTVVRGPCRTASALGLPLVIRALGKAVQTISIPKGIETCAACLQFCKAHRVLPATLASRPISSLGFGQNVPSSFRGRKAASSCCRSESKSDRPILRWYRANQAASFAVGQGKRGQAAFDGNNIWVSNSTANTVTKLEGQATETSLGGVRGRGNSPTGHWLFDGADIWVADQGLQQASPKLRASDGTSSWQLPPWDPLPSQRPFDGTKHLGGEPGQ